MQSENKILDEFSKIAFSLLRFSASLSETCTNAFGQFFQSNSHLIADFIPPSRHEIDHLRQKVSSLEQEIKAMEKLLHNFKEKDK